jgi:hypothetical protein
MAEDKRKQPSAEEQVEAYNRMIKRTHAAIEEAGKERKPSLHEHVETAKEKAVELGELTREEAERISDFVKRDIEDAGLYLSDSSRVLSDWFRFDLQLIEDRMLEMFAKVADRTRLELLDLEEQAERASEYRTGELTGPGSLQCVRCGKIMHFHKTGHIPPCPRCHTTVFQRQEDEEG